MPSLVVTPVLRELEQDEPDPYQRNAHGTNVRNAGTDTAYTQDH